MCGEEQGLPLFPLSQPWVRVSRCQPGEPHLPGPFPQGRLLPAQETLPHSWASLASPVPPHFPVLKSPPSAGPGHPRLRLCRGSRLPTRGQRTPGWHFSGEAPVSPGSTGPPQPSLPAFWLPGTGIMTFLEEAHLPLGCNAMIAPNGVSNHGHCQSGNSSVHPQTAVSRSCGLLQCHPHPPTY